MNDARRFASTAVVNGIRLRDHLGLIGSAVRRYAFLATPRFDLDDMWSVGLVALWRALRRYDASRGRVSSYAVPAIRRDIRRAILVAARNLIEVSLDEPHAVTGEPFIDSIALDEPGPEADAITAERAAPVREALASLPERLRAIVVASVVDESTLDDIGQGLERPVSSERVRQLRNKALDRLREEIDRRQRSPSPAASRTNTAG